MSFACGGCSLSRQTANSTFYSWNKNLSFLLHCKSISSIRSTWPCETTMRFHPYLDSIICISHLRTPHSPYVVLNGYPKGRLPCPNFSLNSMTSPTVVLQYFIAISDPPTMNTKPSKVLSKCYELAYRHYTFFLLALSYLLEECFCSISFCILLYASLIIDLDLLRRPKERRGNNLQVRHFYQHFYYVIGPRPTETNPLFFLNMETIFTSRPKRTLDT